MTGWRFGLDGPLGRRPAAPARCLGVAVALSALVACGPEEPAPRCNEPGAPECPDGMVCVPADDDWQHRCMPACRRPDPTQHLFVCDDGSTCITDFSLYHPCCWPGRDVRVGEPCDSYFACERGAYCGYEQPYAEDPGRKLCFWTCNPFAPVDTCPEGQRCTVQGCMLNDARLPEPLP